jgi:threonine dehydratase
VHAVEALGAEVVLTGDTYDDASQHAEKLAASERLTVVHPFADPDVIAGQGTIGVELAAQLDRPPDAVFLPVGGGGLIGGVGAYLKHVFPDVRIIGVEPYESPSMFEALRSGGPVRLDHVGIFADGVAVRRVSDETYRLAREVAGLKRYVEREQASERLLVAINSGANINFDRLRHVSERAEIGEHREALLAVEIPERPGAFLAFCEALGSRNVTEFNYRYAEQGDAKIFVGVGLRDGRREASALIASLTDAGYRVLDLTDNELAKLHVRHLVGGRVASLADEVLYRFEFPERPGALLGFLRAIGDRWNISLFHYRNHGSDYGRVLAGIQLPAGEAGEFSSHLAKLGYDHWDESANPAYRLFLGSGS